MAQMPSLGIVIMSKNCKNGSYFCHLWWQRQNISLINDTSNAVRIVLLPFPSNETHGQRKICIFLCLVRSCYLMCMRTIFFSFHICLPKSKYYLGPWSAEKLCCVSWNLQLIENESVYCTFHNHSNMQRSISISKSILHNSWAFEISNCNGRQIWWVRSKSDCGILFDQVEPSIKIHVQNTINPYHYALPEVTT